MGMYEATKFLLVLFTFFARAKKKSVFACVGSLSAPINNSRDFVDHSHPLVTPLTACFAEQSGSWRKILPLKSALFVQKGCC